MTWEIPRAVSDALDNYIWAIFAIAILAAMGFPQELAAAFLGAVIRQMTTTKSGDPR